MTQEEQIRLYRLMEKLNWFFHQEMHYLDGDIAEQTAQAGRLSVSSTSQPEKWKSVRARSFGKRK